MVWSLVVLTAFLLDPRCTRDVGSWGNDSDIRYRVWRWQVLPIMKNNCLWLNSSQDDVDRPVDSTFWIHNNLPVISSLQSTRRPMAGTCNDMSFPNSSFLSWVIQGKRLRSQRLLVQTIHRGTCRMNGWQKPLVPHLCNLLCGTA